LQATPLGFRFVLENGSKKAMQGVTKPEDEPIGGSEIPDSDHQVEDSAISRERIIAALRLMWVERRLLFRFACVGLVLSTLIAFLIHARYTSQAQLMPPDSDASSSLALVAGLAGQAGGMGSLAGDLLGMKSTGALFVGVLGSRTVQDRIVQRFDLKKVYRVRLEETARQKLASNTSVSADRKSGIITLSVTDRDPKRAAAIAGAYVEELDTLMAQVSTSSARREREFLEQRLDAVRQDLDSAEKNFSQFTSKSGTVDITEQGKAMVGAAATLEGQLIAAETQLQGLKQSYSDNNVRIRTVQARITELRHQLQELSGKAGSPPVGDETPSDSVYPTLRQLPILGVPYADLFRRLKIEEAVYETLTKQFELAKVEEAKEVPTVKILDSPELPERKSYPPRLFMMISGTLAALVLGMLWILGKSHWQGIDPRDPTKLFAEEVFHGVSARAHWLASSGNPGSEPVRPIEAGHAENDSLDARGG
jgi:capsule polysaccharide export protein KpsE/RkpR